MKLGKRRNLLTEEEHETEDLYLGPFKALTRSKKACDGDV